MSPGRSWTRAALVLAAVIGLDQATKALMRSGIEVGGERDLVLGIRLVHTTNDGIAFGALSGRPFVIVVVLLALGGLVGWFALHAARPWIWLPTGLLLGGALGNLVDRVRDGAVTDFVKLPAWPAFNLADTAITFGVLSLLIVLERGDAVDRSR